jgi:hypothetical protein
VKILPAVFICFADLGFENVVFFMQAENERANRILGVVPEERILVDESKKGLLRMVL